MDAVMLSQLTEGLDDDFWSAVPTPDPSPVKKPLRPSIASFATPTTPTRRPAPAKPANGAPPSSTQFPTAGYDLSEFLQGSEHWDLDEDPFTPIKPAPSRVNATVCPPKYTPDPCTRCIVLTVADEYVNNRWRKSVIGRVDNTDEQVQVYLCDEWYYTDVRPDDVFNVLGHFTPACSLGPRTINITAAANLLILHPDLLTTATALSTAPQCRRKPLLAGLIRATSDITPALVYGSVLHEVLQRCLREDRWEQTFLDTCIEETVQAMLGDLVKLGVSEEVARREVADRARGLIPFQQRYLTDEPKSNGALTNTRNKNDDTPALLAISKLLDIEEDIWSPTYGLKGKIDATVQGIILDPVGTPSGYGKKLPLAGLQRTRTSTPLPLELKTGRSNAGMEHRAQTLLYTLLLSERYGEDVQDGLLFYSQSEDGSVVRVPRSRNEIKALIGVRNELASWSWRRVRKRKDAQLKGVDVRMDVDVAEKKAKTVQEADEEEEEGPIEPFLPPPIDDERACRRCYTLDTCLLFRKTYPNHSGDPTTKKTRYDPPIPDFMKDVFEMKTGHLTESQTRFFRKWEGLLALEERDLVRFKRELWTLGSAEREKRGRCWSGMVLTGTKPKPAQKPDNEILSEASTESKIHRFTYVFARSRHWTPPAGQTTSLRDGHLNTGDPVTVSVEPNMLALVKGYILELGAAEVVLGVDRALDVAALCARTGLAPGADLVFRIDKDEMFGGMARMRGNLAHLFYADGDAKRRSLVVDLRAPLFSAPTPAFDASATRHAHFNASQKDAMARVLAAEDYALVLGMPGTGKTTLVAALIRELVGRGKSVLLTSYTHSAVDTILRALADERDGAGCEFGVLRLGNPDKVHPEVRRYTLGARRTATTVAQFEQQIMASPVVATTCLSIDHPLFFRRKFDFCIVDEASQITLPTCLGPLHFADTFVLVGDHFQLPPLVKNAEARKGGLDVSLFRRLSEAHPEAVVDLHFQYRMNADIMTLSNRLIYNDRLQCGNDEVANAALRLEDRTFLDKLHGSSNGWEGQVCKGAETCWLEGLAAESCKAVFVDTDLLPAAESRVGDLVQNAVEAELVRQLTETLVRCGVQESQIGVVTLYRQQVKLLQGLLHTRPGVEVLTADKSQGRDKDCIVISLVRSNDGGHIGDLVKDWRRMNVSFTRARKKLVIVGSRRTLQREPLLASFFALMQEKGWIRALAPGAHKAHARVFDVAASPAKRGAGAEEDSDAPAVDAPVKDAPVKRGGAAIVCKKKAQALGKENVGAAQRPVKKLKLSAEPVKSVKGAGAGVLKGRPILRDLVENET